MSVENTTKCKLAKIHYCASAYSRVISPVGADGYLAFFLIVADSSLFLI
jgi:hypothetical protein